MAFAAKPGKPLKRSKPLQAKGPIKPAAGLSAKPTTATDQRKALQRATLRALEKARLEASASGVELSQWESEFIEDVSGRVRTYGRAFADPDKGAINGTLSLRQGVKLKEIRRKARKGKTVDPS